MKRGTLIFLVFILSFLLFQKPFAYAGFKDMLKSIEKLFREGKVSEDEITRGLKEALEIGTSNAVEKVSQVDGYFKNPKIKIPLPDAIRNLGNLMRVAGYDATVDNLELSMNRAAEHAASEAKPIFWESIKAMTIEDAQKILHGRDDEATLYFKDKTYHQLKERFKPSIHQAMSEVGVTRLYQEMDEKVRSVPFAEKITFDLDQYVTDYALEGLFAMLAEEEKKIRQDPSARITELLKKVFKSQ